MIGGGVGSRIFSTFRFGGETLHSFPPHGGVGGGGQPHGGGAGGGHFGDGSTNTHDSLIRGGGGPSHSTRSITLGHGFLGCSVILSMMVCG